MAQKDKINLKDVPETMLWTLHNRAVEATRSDGIIKDEKAIEIYKSIDYDYERSFGKADPYHAIRSLVFDKEIRAFLKKHPDGTVINLGEGLETQRFRIVEKKALWLSVDLPEAMEVRGRFIQADERHLHIPLSATDKAWLNSVPRDKPVFVTAQGLFMYFTQDDVKSLLQSIMSTCDYGYIMFDTIPKWLSKKSTSKTGWAKTKHYTVPKLPWGINRNEFESTFKNWLDVGVKVTDIGYSVPPRGIAKWSFLFAASIPWLKNIFPSIVKINYGKHNS